MFAIFLYTGDHLYDGLVGGVFWAVVATVLWALQRNNKRSKSKPADTEKIVEQEEPTPLSIPNSLCQLDNNSNITDSKIEENQKVDIMVQQTSNMTKSTANNDMDYMYCRYCGKKIANDSLFCQYCGSKLGEISNLTGKAHSLLFLRNLDLQDVKIIGYFVWIISIILYFIYGRSDDPAEYLAITMLIYMILQTGITYAKGFMVRCFHVPYLNINVKWIWPLAVYWLYMVAVLIDSHKDSYYISGLVAPSVLFLSAFITYVLNERKKNK